MISILVTISTTSEEVLNVGGNIYHNGIQQSTLADDAYFTSPHPPDQQNSPPGNKVNRLHLFSFL